MRLLHLVRDDVPVDIHGGADVAVPHELLLYGNRGSGRVQPRAVCVPHAVCAELADPGCYSRFDE